MRGGSKRGFGGNRGGGAVGEQGRRWGGGRKKTEKGKLGVRMYVGARARVYVCVSACICVWFSLVRLGARTEAGSSG